MAGVGCEVSGVGTNIQHLTPETCHLTPVTCHVFSMVPKIPTRVDPHDPLNPRSISD